MGAVVVDPELWEAVAAGDTAVLDRWLVSEGERVRAGQLLATATLVHETVDVRSPHDGVLEQVLVAAGERFAPGHMLARVIDF
jgi:pyruvate/2-oxoglutarate dehydrogenase complex dihydrolipoamide acyltransferase (E2) component